MVPGDSKWTRQQDGNPSLNKLDTKESGMTGAYTISGNKIIYEFSIPLFQDFPDSSYEISAGDWYNFDVILWDADSTDKAIGLTWTPGMGKASREKSLGYLYFLEKYKDVDISTGTVVSKEDGKSLKGIHFDIYDTLLESIVDHFESDKKGKYKFLTMPGEYVISSSPGQGIEPIEFTIEIGVEKAKAKRKIEVEIIKIPDEFKRAGAIYDSTFSFSADLEFGGFSTNGVDTMFIDSKAAIAFEKENKLRYENKGEKSPYSFYIEEGNCTVYNKELNQYLFSSFGRCEREKWVFKSRIDLNVFISNYVF